MFYQTIDEAITCEGLNSRLELVEKLQCRFSTYDTMPDAALLELANQYRAEKMNIYSDRVIANDPVDW
jgi:hypothetical protein